MQVDQPLGDLPQSFRDEQALLVAAGITTWSALKRLEDQELNRLATGGLAPTRNLKRLRGMAALVCDLDLELADAALLIHSGLATAAALAAATPQDVVHQTGRLQRQLNNHRQSSVDLAMANHWIQLARTRQLQN